MMLNNNFHFLVPVWGDAFTQRFIEVSLPMLLALNIKANPRHQDNRFVIITTYHDANTIRRSEALQRLRQIMPVRFILVDGFVDFNDPYKAMTQCYAMAMHQPEVIPGKTYFLILTPDAFYSENTFSKCFELADQGYYIVTQAGIRTDAESISKATKELLKNAQNPLISQTDLIRLVLNNLHHLSKTCNWFSKTGFIGMWPSNIYWIDETHPQLIAHCFHLHPVMIKSPPKKVPLGTTIDNEFLRNLNYPLKRQYIFTDTYFCIEMSPPNRTWDYPLAAYSELKDVIHWALYTATATHWYYFKHRITLNGCPELPLNPDLEQSADKVINAVLRYQKVKTLIYHHYGSKLMRRIKPLTKRLLAVTKKLKNILFLQKA